MGIGKEIARAFALAGDQLVLCGRNLEPLQQAAAEVSTFEGQATAAVCDVSEDDSVKRFVADTVGAQGRIDVLVNNAGVYGPIGTAVENNPGAWLQALQINLFGVFLMTHYVAPVMIRQKGGSIINLSGGGATSPKPRYSAYASAKSGVVRFTEITAIELAEHNIRVNAIAPGFIATRLHDETIAAAGPDAEAVKKKVEQGGDDPRKAADLALFLASPEAEGITGKLFSAIWDDWKSERRRSATLRGSRRASTPSGGSTISCSREVPKE